MPVAAELGVASVLDVLTYVYHLEGDARGDEFDILCPVHDERHPSCAVNLDSGLWKCLACGAAGDLATLGKIVLREPRESILELLRPRSPEALQSVVQRRLASLIVKPCRPAPASLPEGYEPGPLAELVGRGFTPDTLREWEVQYCTSQRLLGKRGPFTIRDAIAIPIRDEHDRIVNWCYRRTELSPAWQPRYLYFTDGVSEVWYGARRAKREQHVSVVEGALDTQWCQQNGLNSVGMLGSHVESKRKLYWLTQFKSVTMFADHDRSGALSVQRVGQAIGHLVPLYVAQYDPLNVAQGSKDPQDLDPVDLEIAHARRISWATFLTRIHQPQRA